MYKLEGEDALIFSFLTTMDGNDSLKRVLRRAKTDGSEQEPTLGPSKEREDSRDGGEDYFLTREQVDKWVKGRVADILPTDVRLVISFLGSATDADLGLGEQPLLRSLEEHDQRCNFPNVGDI